ncbi:MAG: pentapeptide repeat-containing protein, partial [Chlorobium sp.]
GNTITTSGDKATRSWASMRKARFVSEPETAPPVYLTPPEPVYLSDQPEDDGTSAKNRSGSVKNAPQSREKQQALLIDDVETWNSMRSKNPELPITLKQEKLENARLRGVNLQQASMAGSDFEDANLDEALLNGADFSGSNFQKADMKGAKLQGAKLQKANFDRTFLREADLSNADLTGANLYGAMLAGANLRGADLSGTSLFDADLEGADLSGAILKGANMMDTNLKNAIITPETILPSGKNATADWAIPKGAIFRKP